MLHFAYGSNMSGAVMRRHAPGAQPIGAAALADYRFVITADGYASVEPRRGESVHGVLWRVTPRDRVMLDAWEEIARGLYRARMLPVRQAGRCRPALVYAARPRRVGRANAGYMEAVVAAAQAWDLPPAYIMSLQRWLPAHPLCAPARKIGERGWT